MGDHENRLDEVPVQPGQDCHQGREQKEREGDAQDGQKRPPLVPDHVLPDEVDVVQITLPRSRSGTNPNSGGTGRQEHRKEETRAKARGVAQQVKKAPR